MEIIRGRLEEYFASVWKLLSDTNQYLSRTSLLPQYESRIRHWRRELQQHANDHETLSEIRREIVTLRKELRQRGYNLRLGQYEVSVAGFRSDEAMGLGFSRAVLLDSPSDIYILTGQANHIELKLRLEQDLKWVRHSPEAVVHSLWYRWDNRLLRISGADSETREDFLLLQDRADREPMRYISAFRNH